MLVTKKRNPGRKRHTEVVRRYIQYPGMDRTAYTPASHMPLTKPIAGPSQPPTPQHRTPKQHHTCERNKPPFTTSLLCECGLRHRLHPSARTLIDQQAVPVLSVASITRAVLVSGGISSPKGFVMSTLGSSILLRSGPVEERSQSAWSSAGRWAGWHRKTSCRRCRNVERRKCRRLQWRGGSWPLLLGRRGICLREADRRQDNARTRTSRLRGTLTTRCRPDGRIRLRRRPFGSVGWLRWRRWRREERLAGVLGILAWWIHWRSRHRSRLLRVRLLLWRILRVRVSA